MRERQEAGCPLPHYGCADVVGYGIRSLGPDVCYHLGKYSHFSTHLSHLNVCRRREPCSRLFFTLILIFWHAFSLEAGAISIYSLRTLCLFSALSHFSNYNLIYPALLLAAMSNNEKHSYLELKWARGKKGCV